MMEVGGEHLTQTVEEAARRDEVAEAMMRFFSSVDLDVAAKSPRCTNRGECCNFARYGHRLYVTSIELATFRRSYGDRWLPPIDGEGCCPWQVDGLCSARESRPLGCRVFFCDPDAAHWQNAYYEKRLNELKRMTAELGIRYQYVEWLSALDAVGSDCRPASTHSEPVLAAFATRVDPATPGAIQLTVVK